MKKQMGPVLIQLPNTVSFDQNVAENLYKLLTEKFSPYKFALEVRHPTWMTGNSYALMEKYDIALVISHSGDHFPYAEVITSKNIYFRFHGPGSLYNTKYDDAVMEKYASLFKKWLDKKHDLWIFFNNTWFGYGIDNALSLRTFLTHLTQQVPAD